MIEILVGVVVGFVFITSIIVVAASMNSSRISAIEREKYTKNNLSK
jgi:hypothetical protein